MTPADPLKSPLDAASHADPYPYYAGLVAQRPLYFDAALFFNLIYNKPDAYPIDNITNPVCTTPDASTCTTSTLLPGADYNRYLFADSLYFTPAAQRLFVNGDQAENVLDRFKDRW